MAERAVELTHTDVTDKTTRHARMSRDGPLGDASFWAAAATGAFVAALSGRPLPGAVMFLEEVGRMTVVPVTAAIRNTVVFRCVRGNARVLETVPL